MKLTGVLFAFLGFINSFTDAKVNVMSAITIVTQGNFDSSITKHRNAFVSCVLFYKNKEADDYIKGWYEETAAALKGMIKVAAMDCNTNSMFCKQQNVGDKPVIMIYPPNPIPAFIYEGKLDKDALSSHLSRFIPKQNVKTLTKENLQPFLKNEVSMPKVLLFGSRNASPPIFNALANSFQKEMHFGFVPPEYTIDKDYGVKKRPAIILLRNGETKSYQGDFKSFNDIYTWLNLYRETFVQGGGFAHTTGPKSSGPEEKPWINDALPELSRASHQPVCFKHSEGFCVVLLTSGQISDENRNMMLDISVAPFIKNSTAQYRFMWMDVDKETEWKALLKPEVLPSVVVINPHRRRFMLNQAVATVSSITDMFERIASGDGRFKPIPGQKLPTFANVSTSAAERSRDEL